MQLLKIFPNSYIRNLPGSKASKRDASKREKLTDVDDFASDPAYRQRRQSVSRFSVRLKEAARQPQAPPPELPYLDHPFTKRSSRRGTLSTLRSITPSEYSKPTRTFLGNTEVRIPKYNAQRRGGHPFPCPVANTRILTSALVQLCEAGSATHLPCKAYRTTPT